MMRFCVLFLKTIYFLQIVLPSIAIQSKEINIQAFLGGRGAWSVVAVDFGRPPGFCIPGSRSNPTWAGDGGHQPEVSTSTVDCATAFFG